MTRAPSSSPYRLRPLAVLVGGLLLALAPLAPELPPWLPPVLVVLAGWRLALEARRRPLPSRWFVVALAAAGSAAALASGVWSRGPRAVLAVFVVLLGVKLLETRTARDRAMGVLLGYFAVLTTFFHRDGLGVAALMALAVWVLTAALVEVADERGARPLHRNLVLAAQLLAQSAPLALALFLLFPRLGVPLWGAPKDARVGRSGLSDEMAPGSIGRVVLSEEVAFRVSFDQGSRAPGLLYWRGPVFDATDGTTWRAAGGRPVRDAASAPRGAELVQRITLEPGAGRWLPALDTPVAAPANGRLTDTLSLLSARPVEDRTRYRAVSAMPPFPSPLSDDLRARALQLPPRVSPRVRALARSLGEGTRGGGELVARILRHLRTEAFFYTLEPPVLVDDPVDRFLFETRRGFCEHYAGAFTLLARVAGVPARVVTGYLGGEWNPVGEYWIVRQSDAHAWSEVWLEGQGWVRVDPTSSVAPERVERRSDAGGPGPARFLPLAGKTAGRWLLLAWDSVDNGWNQWVLGYGTERQLGLLTRLGFSDVTWQRLTWALAAAVALFVAGTTVRVTLRLGAPSEPAVVLYRRYCRTLGRRGVPRLPHEGPRTYARRVAAARPAWAQGAQRVTEAYEALRYGPPPADRAAARKALGELREAVRRMPR